MGTITVIPHQTSGSITISVVDGGLCTSTTFEDLSAGLSNDDVMTPGSFELYQNYPNPFNPETRISFTIPSLSEISLEIYDLNGRVVDVLVQGLYSEGTYSMVWDGLSINGDVVSSGVYIYKLITPDKSISKHLTIIR